MNRNNLLNVKSSIILHLICHSYWQEINRFCLSINDYPNITTSAWSKRKIVIKSTVIISYFQNGSSIYNYAFGSLMFFFNLLGVGTLGYHFCNIIFHVIPPIDLSKILIHFHCSMMAEYFE